MKSVSVHVQELKMERSRVEVFRDQIPLNIKGRKGESITYAIIKNFFLLKNIYKQLNTIETQYFNVETQMGKTTMFVLYL